MAGAVSVDDSGVGVSFQGEGGCEDYHLGKRVD